MDDIHAAVTARRTPARGWQGVQDEVLRRLRTRHWKPGDQLPNEADLAIELGCSRTTVNRALQGLADDGLLERRRRGGTRVVMHPESKATFSIPIVRAQVERRGAVYGYRLLERRRERASALARVRMDLPSGTRLLHLRALHEADGLPWALEDRWIDTQVVPAADTIDFAVRSANEWLVETVPFGSGSMALAAVAASEDAAEVLRCDVGDSLFLNERSTRDIERRVITWVRMMYAPGYQMTVEL